MKEFREVALKRHGQGNRFAPAGAFIGAAVRDAAFVRGVAEWTVPIVGVRRVHSRS